MAGEIQLNGVSLASESGGLVTVNSAVSLIGLGSVIETINLPCSGQSQTVKSGTYTTENVIAIQNLTTSFADITGSSITYTPPATATRVVYSFTFQNSFGDRCAGS